VLSLPRPRRPVTPWIPPWAGQGREALSSQLEEVYHHLLKGAKRMTLPLVEENCLPAMPICGLNSSHCHGLGKPCRRRLAPSWQRGLAFGQDPQRQRAQSSFRKRTDSVEKIIYTCYKLVRDQRFGADSPTCRPGAEPAVDFPTEPCGYLKRVWCPDPGSVYSASTGIWPESAASKVEKEVARHTRWATGRERQRARRGLAREGKSRQCQLGRMRIFSQDNDTSSRRSQRSNPEQTLSPAT
jgi:hypothetical protein